MTNLLFSMGVSFFILIMAVIIFGVVALYAFIVIEMQGIKQHVAVFLYWFIIITAAIYFST